MESCLPSFWGVSTTGNFETLGRSLSSIITRRIAVEGLLTATVDSGITKMIIIQLPISMKFEIELFIEGEKKKISIWFYIILISPKTYQCHINVELAQCGGAVAFLKTYSFKTPTTTDVHMMTPQEGYWGRGILLQITFRTTSNSTCGQY